MKERGVSAKKQQINWNINTKENKRKSRIGKKREGKEEVNADRDPAVNPSTILTGTAKSISCKSYMLHLFIHIFTGKIGWKGSALTFSFLPRQQS